ncbi:MAG TPA: NAD(P)/FAD-dependent oxidoreductase [Alphaproteobacteria bacterium]|nr:NAD(P)/FAD-dependent oxidoreductase [Alphaproteobacteria bacterium]
MDNPDIIVIGGGIAGGAMATVLARRGLHVVMLEITKEHRDVVRGEVLSPWGVAETQTLGLYDDLVKAGGHFIKRIVNYSEEIDPATAEQMSADASSALPGVPGNMAIGHPRACNTLDAAAVSAGAVFLRGVRHTEVSPAPRPRVRFEHDGEPHTIYPRLVIAADGRHGITRKQIGIPLHEDPLHNWQAGLLIEGAHDWPDDTGCIATEGDSLMAAFPQGDGRVRLYNCLAIDAREEMIGPKAVETFLRRVRMKCAPHSDALAGGRPVSELFVYPNNDTWTNQPYVEGVVLIGDAAGRNDPVIGQGLANAYRDVRIVSDILKEDNWGPWAFAPYAQERAERMRRLRIIGRAVAHRDAEFGREASNRRRRAIKNMMERPELGSFFAAMAIGPEKLPPETYSDQVIAAVCGD